MTFFVHLISHDRSYALLPGGSYHVFVVGGIYAVAAYRARLNSGPRSSCPSNPIATSDFVTGSDHAGLILSDLKLFVVFDIASSTGNRSIELAP